jgi:glycosyltransferase involved in cell wall biosynthesis
MSNGNKILIISYYWPPSGGGGVQRITKFCKFLVNHGWEPHVITAPRQKYKTIDPSFIKDVKGVKVYYTGVNEKQENNTSSKQSKKTSRINIDKVKAFIRVNFLIPDAKIFWYKSALKTAKKVLEKEKFDLLFSTSPPYTVQLVAKKINKISGLKWIVDFRDPWVENIYYNNVFRLWISKYLNRRLETKVLSQADVVLTVGDKLKLMLEKKTDKKIYVIHNGYDQSDYPAEIEKSEKFIIGYYGSLNSNQVSDTLFEILSRFETTQPKIYENLELHLAGVHTQDAISFIKKYIPEEKIVFHGYVSHDTLLKQLCKEQLLLQLIHEQKDNEIIIGSKLYEYFHTGNPILCLGNKKSEAAELIEETSSGVTYNYEEEVEIEKYIILNFNSWSKGELNINKRNLPKYERSNQAKELVDIFNSMVN